MPANVSKTSDWKIVATEGATVDGRAISANWIKDMAETYDLEKYPALIWPEHQRSGWSIFEGKNWGTVEALKAAKYGDKLRLFAKLTPNHYLIEANKDEQKLFTSIEPEPDFQGQGRCYLMGLAVTDSPASVGTTRLKFSKNSEHEYSELEALDLSEYYTVDKSNIAKAFSTLAQFFKAGGELPQAHFRNKPDHTEDTDVTKQELAASLKELLPLQFATLKTELKDELKHEFAKKEPATVEEEAPQHFTAADLSAELEKQLKPLNDQVTELKDKFAKLEEEAPGQRPNNTGGGEDTKPSFV